MEQINNNIGQEEFDAIRFEITRLELEDNPDNNERIKDLKKQLRELEE